MNHPLHEKIGDLIEGEFKDYQVLKIVKDPACCRGDETDLQQIPLFRSDKKSRRTRYCCVDMLNRALYIYRNNFNIDSIALDKGRPCPKCK